MEEQEEDKKEFKSVRWELRPKMHDILCMQVVSAHYLSHVTVAHFVLCFHICTYNTKAVNKWVLGDAKAPQKSIRKEEHVTAVHAFPAES